MKLKTIRKDEMEYRNFDLKSAVMEHDIDMHKLKMDQEANNCYNIIRQN